MIRHLHPIMLSIAFWMLAVIPASAMVTELDPTFGENGVDRAFLAYNTKTLNMNAHIEEMLLDDRGRILILRQGGVTGRRSGGTITRHLPNGGMDTGFGSNGSIVPKGSGTRQLLIDKNQRIYWVGVQRSVESAYRYHPKIIRITPNGNKDTTYGNNSTALINIQETFGLDSHFYLINTTFDSQGRMLVQSFSNSDHSTLIFRLTTSGKIDFSFAPGGYHRFSIEDKLLALPSMAGKYVSESGGIWDNSGRLLVVFGNGPYYPFNSFGFIRVLIDGTLDTTFNNGNPSFIDVDTKRLWLGPNENGITTDSKGRILLRGSAHNNPSAANDGSGAQRAVVARLTADGKPDTSFGPGGRRIFSILKGGENAHFVYPLPDDGVLVIGRVHQNQGFIPFVTAFTKDGNPHPAYGTQGHLLFPSDAIWGYNPGNKGLSVNDSYNILDKRGRLLSLVFRDAVDLDADLLLRFSSNVADVELGTPVYGDLSQASTSRFTAAKRGVLKYRVRNNGPLATRRLAIRHIVNRRVRVLDSRGAKCTSRIKGNRTLITCKVRFQRARQVKRIAVLTRGLGASARYRSIARGAVPDNKPRNNRRQGTL